MDMLLSIRTESAEAILDGKKTIEFRKIFPKNYADFGVASKSSRKDVDDWSLIMIDHVLLPKVYLYATAPVQKVIGTVEIARVLAGSPDGVWELAGEKSGMLREQFDRYYGKKTKAYAWVLENPMRFDPPRPLSELGIREIPQSFSYIKLKNRDQNRKD